MRKKITATIITIGDELLIGQVIDTNSAYIAQQLNKTGIVVVKRLAVADKAADIIKAIDEEIGKVDIVLTTGGLGPTSDDITRETLAKYFKCRLVINEAAMNHLTYLYEKVYQKPISQVNLKQAKVPACCEVIVNKRGSAPAMIFQKKGTYLVSMAGVPFEMEGIMEDVIPFLKLHFQLPKVLHQTLITTGIGESDLAAQLSGFEKTLPKNTQLAYLPGPAGLRLRLSSTVFNKSQETEVKKQFSTLKKLTKQYLAVSEDIAPEVLLGRLLKRKKQTVSTAESCTGGYIASRITSIPGSSDYYPGSIVSYSNQVKEKELGVKRSTLKKHGAVSEEVVREMLAGLLRKMKTNFGIAVSGIMGPGGGSADKPVGTVWIAVGTVKKNATKKLVFRFDRKRNIEGTTAQALYLLKNFIEENG